MTRLIGVSPAVVALRGLSARSPADAVTSALANPAYRRNAHMAQ
ncbi:hypothetical protein [Kitasatospora sp. NPDC056531]